MAAVLYKLADDYLSILSVAVFVKCWGILAHYEKTLRNLHNFIDKKKNK